jgi:hypothetical protein
MSILDELKALQQKHAKPKPKAIDGFSYPSDAVTISALYRVGVDEETIKEVLSEPVESRDWYIQYFEDKNK